MSFQNLDDLIEDLKKTHKNIAQLWKQSKDFCSVNLAKKFVVDVMDINRHPEYLDYIFKHRSFLFEKLIAYGIELNQRGYESRVKTQNSIESKLNIYMGQAGSERRALKGELPLKKCLNDLFGVRFVFENNEYALSAITAYLKDKYPELKVRDSSKDSYKGVHVYFQEDNYTFPWELQVWNREDVENNRISHSKYKQEYTKWEGESKKEVK